MAIFGFQGKCSCDDVTAVLRQVLFLASRWNLNMILGSLDVEFAFDSMQHDCMALAMKETGVNPVMIRNLVREMSFMRCSMKLPGGGMSFFTIHEFIVVDVAHTFDKHSFMSGGPHKVSLSSDVGFLAAFLEIG